ncbi:MAG: MFS transporter [Ignavibacteria bacterium]
MEEHRPEPSRAYRWFVLLIVSLPMFGNYYIYDSINPLTDIFQKQLGYTDSQIGWLNSSYSVAAVITLLIGGVLIDRLGVKKAMLLFGTICSIAALLSAMGDSFVTMVVGRTVLGLGAESLIVAVTTALAKWFRGKELSFAFGVNLTIARLASVAADNSPTWASAVFYPHGHDALPSWQGPLWLAFGIGLICVMAGIMYWWLETRAQRQYQLGKPGAVDKLEIGRGMFRYSPSYWYIVGLCFTFYSAVFPFRTFAVKFFQHVHGIPLEEAGFFNSLLPLSAMIATPLFGLLVDSVGKRALFMLFGTLLLVPVYLMMLNPAVTLWAPTIMLGIAFSLIPAVMWPSVAYIVEEHRLGTAYALMTLIQQIGFFALNWLIGAANDWQHASETNPGGYALGMGIFTGLVFLGFVFSFLLRKAETGPGAHGLETIMARASDRAT